jgi:pimeloyl-ACP methyl ester carboxylesterase
MSISPRQHTVVTSHGSLAVEESAQGGIPVLLIHGSSSCRAVFRHQMQGRIVENHRLIAFDLPGHGESSNAPDPTRSYTRPGLADATVESLEKLGVTEAIVVGWSLGGHVGIEMVPLGHAPFWEAPGDFDPVLERFLQDVETGRAATRTL